MFIPVIICCPHFPPLSKPWIFKWLLNWSQGPAWWQRAGQHLSLLKAGAWPAAHDPLPSWVPWGEKGGGRYHAGRLASRRRAAGERLTGPPVTAQGSALINEGVWKTISRSRFTFNCLINQSPLIQSGAPLSQNRCISTKPEMRRQLNRVSGEPSRRKVLGLKAL